jgi:tetratricopeptide (TPR) repeat protein
MNYNHFSKRRIPVFFLLLTTVLMMSACSCGGTYQTNTSVDPNNSVFSPLTEKNTAVLTNAITWAKEQYSSINTNYSDEMVESVNDRIKEDFKAANDLYKAGEFEKAKAAYELIIEYFPPHLGARNNYVLTLAQLGEYEESLKNSILLGLLYPDYDGNWVNILIPLYALGYDEYAYIGKLTSNGFPSLSGVTNGEAQLADAFTYNSVYTNMEAAYGEEELAEKMSHFKGILETLKNSDPNDTDYSELFAYLEGLEKIR